MFKLLKWIYFAKCTSRLVSLFRSWKILSHKLSLPGRKIFASRFLTSPMFVITFTLHIKQGDMNSN
jgi:hypothetical protein